MRVLTGLLSLVLALAPATLSSSQKQGASAPSARWKGTSYSGEALTAAVGPKAAEAAALWWPWADAHGYAIDLDPELRRLFVHAEKRGASSETALLARALAAVDKLAPRAPDGKPGAILVILELEGPKDFGSLLDDLGRRYAYLASWAQGEKQQLGFTLEEPLSAAFLATPPPEVKEWNPKNELVNRSAQTALFERAGRLPNWLVQGLAWNVELGVCGSIFCFPFRSGFVAKKEHRSWSEQLKGLMAPPGTEAVRAITIDDLAGWKRGTYENDRALLAWGAASFLAKKHPDALPLILDDLRAVREKESKVTKPDGSWTINPDYEVPAAKQLEILKARAGDDFLDALGRFCAGN